MNPQSRGQEQAIAILAIATAVIGFGLFGGDFYGDALSTAQGESLSATHIRILRIAKVAFGIMVVAYYVSVFGSVRRILVRKDEVTGKDVADGPLAQLSWQVLFLAQIFGIDLFEKSITD